jgi:TatD DNase family protein
MIFADTHAHIYLDEFDKDRDKVLERAFEAGVHHIFLPNIDSGSIEQLLNCIQGNRHKAIGIRNPESAIRNPEIYPLMGLHPGSVKEDYREELRRIEQELENGSYCGIGEIGIDLYWDKTFRTQQEEVFSRQLDLAVDLDLPVVIHTRNSFDIAADIVESKRNPALKGIFHCFSGNLAQAKRAVKLGFLLGIGGVVTYKNSGLRDIVHQISLDHLVLETDAPYLPPVPHRGERNEPAWIPVIAQKIAEIKNTSLETVAEVTTRNAIELFT